jgi:hypothetical protein
MYFPTMTMRRGQEARMFFFEKKNQKTFTSLGACWSEVRDSDQKFFASFFQKKKAFLVSWKVVN